MKFSANFDLDVIALQHEETLTCLIQFEAPLTQEDHDRPAECLIPVLDRSGSMRGEPINACKQALHTLIDRMKPQDTFGLIAFDEPEFREQMVQWLTGKLYHDFRQQG